MSYSVRALCLNLRGSHYGVHPMRPQETPDRDNNSIFFTHLRPIISVRMLHIKPLDKPLINTFIDSIIEDIFLTYV